MNAINVTPKTVEVIPARTAEFSSIIWRTLDDSFNKRLQIIVNNKYTINIVDNDYDALGQWTDDTVKNIVLAKYGLTEIV
jgi:hypothetical protein